MPCVRCLFDARNRIDLLWSLGGLGHGRLNLKPIRIKTRRKQLVIAHRNQDYA
jgi:hypothetical protein